MARSPLPFDRNADRWGRYADSLKGRMRRALLLSQLEAHLPAADIPMRVLDAGCGAGDLAASLIWRSAQVTLLDFSTGMLQEAHRRLASRHSPEALARVTLIQGRAEQVDACVPRQDFDLILCHNLLEYMDNPREALHALARRLAPGGLFSLLAANRYAEVFKHALAKFDFDAARSSLGNNAARADLFDRTPKRTFIITELIEMVKELGMNLSGVYGVRLFTDYLPATIADAPENESRLLELEKAAAGVEACLPAANSFHLIGCRPGGSDGQVEGPRR